MKKLKTGSVVRADDSVFVVTKKGVRRTFFSGVEFMTTLSPERLKQLVEEQPSDFLVLRSKKGK